MSARVPGVTFTQSFHHKPAAFKKSKFIDGLKGIMRAGWGKAADITDKGGNRQLIHTDKN